MEQEQKRFLLGMTLPEITEAMIEMGLPKFTGKQVADWVYVKRVKGIDEMTNISLKNRELLSGKFEVGRSDPLEVQTSADDTRKCCSKRTTASSSKR